MKRYQYEALAPLESCEFKDLNRSIGVSVSDPFEHHGLKKQCVEIFRETITVNTKTFGNQGIPADAWQPVAIDYLKQTAEDLQKVIDELEEHKGRLEISIRQLQEPPGPAPAGAKFKVGDRVKVRNDENDQENQDRLDDIESDLGMSVAEGDMTQKQHGVISEAIEKGQPFVITRVSNDGPFNRDQEIEYEIAVKGIDVPFMIDEKDLELIP